jgi:hypothetical protein
MAELSKDQVALCVDFALERAPARSMDDAYFQLGAAIYRLGWEPNETKSKVLFVETKNREKGKEVDPNIDREKTTRAGSDVWDKIKENLKGFVCTPDVKSAIDNTEKLKSVLGAVAVAVLAALPVTIVPLLADIIITILILIAKTGLYTFCNWEPGANRT